MWFWIRGIASRLGLFLAISLSPAQGAERVSLELVLAIDVSVSVNDIEYRQELEGMALAFVDPEVVSLILNHQEGVAVLVTQWGGFAVSGVPMPWRVLRTEQDIAAFATGLRTMPRGNFGYLTAIGNAIIFAVNEIESNGFDGLEKKIDVAGDGRNNAGHNPVTAGALALARGITINGLAIGDSDPGLVEYYAQNVISGPHAFVEPATGFADFAEAFRRKLKRELSPKLADAGPWRNTAGLKP